MGAADAHIAKYTAHYQSWFPDAPILLVKSTYLHMFLFSHGRKEVAPAAAALKALAGDNVAASSTQGKPVAIFHHFSNGGTISFHNLASAMAPSPLPPHVTIFDSTPGLPGYVNGYRAMAHPLPLLLRPLVHAFLVS
jgi:hypothetical protein